jgi:PAS domain S-box-containing protein
MILPDRLHILIIDDNEDHAGLAARFLELSGRCDVEIVGSLAELWQCLAASVYHVALLDYNLPDGNGLDALAEIPARGYHLPVVMVTGRGDERVAAQAIQRGAVDYVVKTGDYLRTLPAVVEKAARTHELVEAAQRSLEKIRYQAMLLDNVGDAVVVWNPEGRITFWNRAAEHLLGYKAEACLGYSVAEKYLCMFDPPVEPPAPGAPALVDVERRCQPHNSDQAIWISSNMTALHDSHGRLVGYIDVCRNISVRKQLEDQVRTFQTHLAQSARLSAIGELASGVAHQISNPLTTIIAEAQLLMNGAVTDDERCESAKAIERAGWRAQRTVQTLMDFSRPAISSLEWLSVNETIRNALTLVGSHFEILGVGLSLELTEGLPPIYGSPRQLEDLWVNLFLHARDATADGQPHHIRLRSGLSAEGHIQVEVNDDGEIIPPGQLKSIFEPDFVGFSNRRGSGLELSICREMVRQHRGQITVDSAPERGTTFTVTLPPEGANGTR